MRELKRLESAMDSGTRGVAIVFPDEGACKRFQSALDQWPIITCVKIREGDKRVVSIKDGGTSLNLITRLY